MARWGGAMTPANAGYAIRSQYFALNELACRVEIREMRRGILGQGTGRRSRALRRIPALVGTRRKAIGRGAALSGKREPVSSYA